MNSDIAIIGEGLAGPMLARLLHVHGIPATVMLRRIKLCCIALRIASDISRIEIIEPTLQTGNAGSIHFIMVDT